MRWIKVIVAILGMLATSGYALAQVDSSLAYETVEPSRIRIGDSAILRVTSFGRLQNVDLPTIPGLAFEQMGRSQGLEFVNGTSIPASYILIRVTAQFAGVFTIPGLAPNSPSIGLEVVKDNAPNPYAWHSQRPAPPPIVTASLPKGAQLQAGGAVFVHLTMPTRAVYVGESVPVDIEVGLRPGIVTTLNGLPTLKGSEFTLNNLSKQPERRQEEIDGSEFVVFTWHSELAAVKPGDFPLSVETPLTVKLSALSAADRAVASRLAYPLLQSMYNGIAPKDITVDSPPTTLTVLPLPTQGRPSNFSGAVGDFQVSSDLAPAGAAAGEPLTLRLHIAGTGNFDRVDSTMFGHLDHWKTYPSKSSFKPSDTVGHQGEKVFEQPLIAAQPGEQSIPGLLFSYFNPDTRQYEQAQTAPIPVTIVASLASGSLNASTGDSPGAAFTRDLIQNLHPDHPALNHSAIELKPLYFRGSFLAIPTSLALMLTGSWFIVRRGTASPPSKAIEHLLAPLEAAARSSDAPSFFEAARRVLLQTFALRWHIPLDAITVTERRTRLGTASDDVERLFALADETRYAGQQPDSADFQRWLRVIRSQLAGEKE